MKKAHGRGVRGLGGSWLPYEWAGGDPWFPEDRSLQYFTVRWWA